MSLSLVFVCLRILGYCRPNILVLKAETSLCELVTKLGKMIHLVFATNYFLLVTDRIRSFRSVWNGFRIEDAQIFPSQLTTRWFALRVLFIFNQKDRYII